MPNDSNSALHSHPKLVVMDLFGAMVEYDEAIRGALAAAFQAHGEHVDAEVASMALGYPGLHGITRILRWLHPNEQPHLGSVQSIHDLAVKECCRLAAFSSSVRPADGVVRLCDAWTAAGCKVAASSTLDAAVVKAMLQRLGWDRNPPFQTLVLAEEVKRPTPGPDLILECMRRTAVTELEAVAKVACQPIGLSDAKQLECGWNVLVDCGTLTTDQIAAVAPSAIVDQVSDLARLWKFPTTADTEIEDEIARILHPSSWDGVS